MNISSGTLHESASDIGPVEENKDDLTSDTLRNTNEGALTSEACAQCEWCQVDRSAQCDINYSTAHTESGVQCDISESTQPPATASTSGRGTPLKKRHTWRVACRRRKSS